MSPTSVSRNIAAPQQKVWEAVSDVTTFEHWHALHAGWEELPPSTIEVGATMVEKIKVAALVDTITFEVESFRPPSEVVFRGKGSTGSKIHMRLGLDASGDTTTVTIDLDVTSPLLVGPVGKALRGTFEKRLRETLDGLSRHVIAV
ncbi:SRPBCC family protein [Rhodococcus sp. BP-241]|uniref:type II toxin-antitoxin system Rv0910 family toxin n=1 Tax=Rhodococcus sp. BP-241 TaxID=2739441 RepID=UPI001C9B6F81|nr:SRPBCC family protein [Rhodococcus sp. BP-241]MBY6709346.1 SRPBCC family protein [Rhodococcus sp. BP-241]